MATELKIPELGESITEAQIGRWLKHEGDDVEKDEPIAELETDKVTVELPAPIAGRITELTAEEGDSANVGDVIGYIESNGAPAKGETDEKKEEKEKKEEETEEEPEKGEKKTARTKKAKKKKKKKAKKKGDDERDEKAEAKEPETKEEEEEDDRKAEGGEKQKQEAKKKERDQADEADEKKAEAEKETKEKREEKDRQAETREEQEREEKEEAEAREGEEAEAAETEAEPSEEAEAQPAGREEEAVAMSPMRKRIAQRLVEAQQTAALLTTFNEIDMSAVIETRRDYQDRFREKYDIKLGFMSFFVKAAVDALKQFPQVNARVDGDQIVYRNYYDIGIAVATERGLVVPIVRDADQLSFAEIERAIDDFGRRARENRITLEELSGGTFTITNGGVFGSLLSTPIVNPPQSGVLGMHAIQKRPIATDDDRVEVRPMMYVALTYDHRLVDGREAVLFLKRIREAVESPLAMMLEV